VWPESHPPQAPGLSPHHYAMLTEGSGIAPEVIAERGYRSIDAAEGYPFLKRLGFTPRQLKRNWPGLYLPRHTPLGGGAVGQYRPDTPRYDEEQRPIKYESKSGGWVGLDVPPRCHTALSDITTRLYVTEGIKKGDALASQGACAVALLGVWCFRANKRILDEWGVIPLRHRSVTIVYDSDVMTNPKVKDALDALSDFLQNRGALVDWCFLPAGPDGEKTGIDDFFVRGGALHELEALSQPATSWEAKLLKTTKQQTPTETISNICLILQHHEYWRGRLWFDTVRTLSMLDDVPLSDPCVSAVAQWLGLTLRMPVRSSRLVERCLFAVCQQAPRDLLREWLASLPP
jgi:Domain of unknown function (DUF3854)